MGPGGAGERLFAGSWSVCHPAPATVWTGACGSAARSECLGRQPESRDRSWSRFSPQVRIGPVYGLQPYILTAGSGIAFPGNDDFRNSIDHCGRTLNCPLAAGTTTASPFARVTGSDPGDSTTPQPSTAVRICTEVFPASSAI